MTGRSSALTMPLVTVASRPNGEPIATTPSPTPRLADLPIVAGVRSETSCGLDDGGVGERVGAEDLGVRAGAVGEGHLDRAAVAGHLDDVVVGEDRAVGGEDDARAGPGLAVAGDVDLHHARQHLLRHRLDRAVGRRASASGRPPSRWSAPSARRPCSPARRGWRPTPPRPPRPGAAAHEERGGDDGGRQARTPSPRRLRPLLRLRAGAGAAGTGLLLGGVLVAHASSLRREPVDALRAGWEGAETCAPAQRGRSGSAIHSAHVRSRPT